MRSADGWHLGTLWTLLISILIFQNQVYGGIFLRREYYEHKSAISAEGKPTSSSDIASDDPQTANAQSPVHVTKRNRLQRRSGGGKSGVDEEVSHSKEEDGFGGESWHSAVSSWNEMAAEADALMNTEVEVVRVTESPAVPNWDEVRNWKDVVKDGLSWRIKPPLERDVSPSSGSQIIDNPEHNYRMKVSMRGLFGSSMAPIAYQNFGIPVEEKYRLITIDNPGTQTGGKSPKIYQFFVNRYKKDGMVIVYNSWKNRDKGEPMEQRFSEILWRMWYDQVERANQNQRFLSETKGRGRKLHDLKYITIDTIINPETMKITDQAFERLKYTGKNYIADAFENVGDEQEHVGHAIELDALHPDDKVGEVFNAIVGSKSGKSIIRMIRDHSQALQGKKIMKIIVFRFLESVPLLIFELRKPPNDAISTFEGFDTHKRLRKRSSIMDGLSSLKIGVWADLTRYLYANCSQSMVSHLVQMLKSLQESLSTESVRIYKLVERSMSNCFSKKFENGSRRYRYKDAVLSRAQGLVKRGAHSRRVARKTSKIAQNILQNASTIWKRASRDGEESDSGESLPEVPGKEEYEYGYDDSVTAHNNVVGNPNDKKYLYEEELKPIAEIVQKGRALRGSQKALRDVSNKGSLLLQNPASKYDAKSERVFIVKQDIEFWIPYALSGNKLPRSVRYVNVASRNAASRNKQSPFELSVSAQKRCLVIKYSFKEDDLTLPKYQENKFSEILFRAWYEEKMLYESQKSNTPAESNRDKLKDLKYIMIEHAIPLDVENLWDLAQTDPQLGPYRDNIELDFREAVEQAGLKEMLPDSRNTIFRGTRLTLNANDPNPSVQYFFDAVIGSTSGRGPAYMLLDHPQALGGKSIVSARLCQINYRVRAQPGEEPNIDSGPIIPGDPRTNEKIHILLELGPQDQAFPP